MANVPLAQFLAVCALPRPVIEKLVEHCAATGESPLDVISDAVTLHLDALGDLLPEKLDEAIIPGGVRAS